jgi:hypothetical protein
MAYSPGRKIYWIFSSSECPILEMEPWPFRFLNLSTVVRGGGARAGMLEPIRDSKAVNSKREDGENILIGGKITQINASSFAPFDLRNHCRPNRSEQV